MSNALKRLAATGTASAPRGARLLAAAALLGGLQWLGDAIVTWTDWPVSGSLIGMLLLLAILSARGRVPESLGMITAPLLRHLMLLLIPSVAAVSMHAALLAQSGGAFVAVSVIVTVLTILATAWTLHRLMRRDKQ